MKKYTIGIVFNPDLTCTMLIQKNRPKWQEGRLNFPGGHIEENENSFDCVSREFKEECDVDISPSDWKYIGRIKNTNDYYVDILTAIVPDSTTPQSLTDETVRWYLCDRLPSNVISNIRWILPFAQNYHAQGNNDSLKFGTFEYE